MKTKVNEHVRIRTYLIQRTFEMIQERFSLKWKNSQKLEYVQLSTI